MSIDLIILSYLDYIQISNGKMILEWWEYTSTPQSLTKSLKTEQQSLWTCCLQLEEPWDFSQDSPLSVEWKSFTLFVNQFLPTLGRRRTSILLLTFDSICVLMFSRGINWLHYIVYLITLYIWICLMFLCSML